MVGILGGAATGAGISIVIRAIDNYSKQFNRLDKKLKVQQSAFKRIGTFLKSTGIGYGILAGAAVGFGISAVKSAIQSERAFQQFNLAMSDSADIMLTDLRRASKGMVSDLELVDNANRALALGVSRSNLPKLLAVATARSKVFGRTATDAFADIAIGIGRQSRLILDNLGIIIDLNKAYKDYKDTLGIVGRELSETEKKIALENAILEESEGLLRAQIFLLETHAEKLQRLGATYSNVKDSIGEFLLLVFDSASGIREQQELLKNTVDTLVGVEGAFDDTGEAILELGSALGTSEERAKGLISSLQDLKDITFVGERGVGLQIAQQKEVIRQLELRKLRGDDIDKQLDKERDQLQILRLESERFGNLREIQQAENSIGLEKAGELTSSGFQEFFEGEKRKFDDLTRERELQDILTEKQKELLESTKFVTDQFLEEQGRKEEGYEAEQDSIQGVIDDTNRLIEKYNEAARARRQIPEVNKGVGFQVDVGRIKRFFGVGDAIIRPNGDVIKTDPRDTLIATKNPEGLGGGGVVINIENVNGLDADAVAEALQERLDKMVLF